MPTSRIRLPPGRCHIKISSP